MLRRHIRQTYGGLAQDLRAKPFMIESLSVWWADVSTLTVEVITTGGAAVIFGGTLRWATVAVAALAVAAFIEAIASDPFQYETSSSVQRLMGVIRQRTASEPPEIPFLSPAITIGIVSALVGLVAILAPSV
jgi:hypothetical protein